MKTEEIRLDKIRPSPYQPRSTRQDEEIENLARSIKEHGGVIQPITVRSKGEYFEIVTGHRRWQACKLLGYKTIPATVCNLNDKEVLETILVENLQRRDLNPIEEAEAFARLRDEFDMTQSRIAQKTGKSRDYVAQRLRILNFPEKIRSLVSYDTITSSVAEAIVAAPMEVQRQIISRIESGWRPTVAQIEGFRKTPESVQQNIGLQRDQVMARIKELETEIAQTQLPLITQGLMFCPACFRTQLKPVHIDGDIFLRYVCGECKAQFSSRDIDEQRPLFSQLFKICEDGRTYDG